MFSKGNYVGSYFLFCLGMLIGLMLSGVYFYFAIGFATVGTILGAILSIVVENE